MKHLGSCELERSVIQGGFCIGCGACVHLCPYFRSYRGKTANLFHCTLEEGRCFAYCPKIEVDLDRLSRFLFEKPYDGAPLGTYRSIHVSRAGAKVKRQAFQSGGTVSALMYFALRNKRIDGAILTGRNGLLPEPRLVTRPADVFRHSLSKYTAAPTLAALNEAVGHGYGNLGVVATPCQATAIAQMRMNPLEQTILAGSHRARRRPVLHLVPRLSAIRGLPGPVRSPAGNRQDRHPPSPRIHPGSVFERGQADVFPR